MRPMTQMSLGRFVLRQGLRSGVRPTSPERTIKSLVAAVGLEPTTYGL